MANWKDRGLAESFGPWLRARLTARRLTYTEAGQLMDTAPATIRQWVRGYGLPSYTQLTRVIALFGELPPGLEPRLADRRDQTQAPVRFRRTPKSRAIRLSWLQALKRLQAYIDEHGHALVPEDHVDVEGFALGRWVAERRSDFARGILGDDRAKLLTGLQGWVWNVHDAMWERKLHELEALMRSTGASNPFEVADEDLRKWMSRQRRVYHEGRMKPERMERLKALPYWSWGQTRRKRN